MYLIPFDWANVVSRDQRNSRVTIIEKYKLRHKERLQQLFKTIKDLALELEKRSQQQIKDLALELAKRSQHSTIQCVLLVKIERKRTLPGL